MRVLALCLATSAVLAIGGQASAKPSVSSKTKFYSISGDSGVALIRAMDRKGPRHGFMTRAIAQTSYAVNWKFGWQPKDGGCQVSFAHADLDITYSYPKVSSAMSPDLDDRWKTFFAGVRKHEETHGRMARQMVSSAEKAAKAVRFQDDANCERTQAEVKKRIATIYVKYEARQVEFDKREHRDGGNVEHLLIALAGQN